MAVLAEQTLTYVIDKDVSLAALVTSGELTYAVDTDITLSALTSAELTYVIDMDAVLAALQSVSLTYRIDDDIYPAIHGVLPQAAKIAPPSTLLGTLQQNRQLTVPALLVGMVMQTPLPHPVTVLHAIEFAVYTGDVENYPIVFQVVEPIITSYPIDFDVVIQTEYPVSFDIVGLTTVDYAIDFTVTGPLYISGTVSFSVVPLPQLFYPIAFNVVESGIYEIPINFYVNSGTTNEGIQTEVVATPSGAGTRGLHLFTFKVFESGSYVGSSDAALRLTAGQGVRVDFLGIPELFPGSMTIYSYDKGTLIHTHSGTYQRYLGVDVL